MSTPTAPEPGPQVPSRARTAPRRGDRDGSQPRRDDLAGSPPRRGARAPGAGSPAGSRPGRTGPHDGKSPHRLERLAQARRAVELPPITYPEELPVAARREQIAAALRDHQVIVVSGETGSGKTTQLPKIALEQGRGRDGQIGHTQPRRIAARTVAERIAEELGTPLGQAVGYQVRFTDHSSDRTLVKVMTDGILLAQIQRDPLLLAYDTLIVDEAHERSLNIDFILGYLTRLLPRRPDLKLVITSATIDSARFAQHFAGAPTAEHPQGLPAPVIEVTGRTYPVEIRYRPLVADDAGLDESAGDAQDDVLASRPNRDGTASARGASARGASARGASARGASAASGSGRPGRGAQLAVRRGARPAGRAGQKAARRAQTTGHGAEDRDELTAIGQAFDELAAEGPGDVLVFCSGEREIRDAADALRSHLGPQVTDPHHPQAVEILPLYGRLSAAEQHRVFEPHAVRRVVIATNVAETSLTVPGVHYVIDTGTARISRYSKQTKVQRLPIEPISQASADQRSGRCGRVANGIAIRLYSRADYESRPQYTEPEILRTSLASVILQMIAVGVVTTPDDVVSFPFVDPPDVRSVRDGVQLLTELGAVTTDGGSAQLTPTGRALAQLPMDPRLARMVVEGGRRGVGHEVMVVAAALSIQDPRERPVDQREHADQLHARFADPTSDLLAYLNLWQYLEDSQRELSGSAFRRMCRAELLSWLRVREWQDVVTQLHDLGRPLGIDARRRSAPPAAEVTGAARPGRPRAVVDAHAPGTSGSAGGDAPGSAGAPQVPAERPTRRQWDADAIHLSVLSGLLSQIGMQEATETGTASGRAGRDAASHGRPDRRGRNEYLGARGVRFAIFPGSGLARRPPAWVMAAELVETSRLWARDVARIRPEWVEELGAHLVRRSYSEPTWSTRQEAATCLERVLLYGLPVVTGRRVLYSQVDPEHARELFIRHALVQGEWTTHHHFFHDNRRLLVEAEDLEARARRRDLVVGDDALFDFYDERIPDDVVSARHFDRWWRDARRRDPDLLTFTPQMLVPETQAVDAAAFPSEWPQGDLRLALTYQFEPGTAADGVTVHIPLVLLPRVQPDGFGWMVPGLLPELVTATIRALPKPVRVQLVPAPDVARGVLAWFGEHLAGWEDTVRAGDAAPSFHEAFAQAVRALRGVQVPEDVFDDERLPAHLRMTFRVVDDAGQVIDEGKDLVAVQRRLAARAEDAVGRAVRTAVGAALEEARARSAASPTSPAAASSTPPPPPSGGKSSRHAGEGQPVHSTGESGQPVHSTPGRGEAGLVAAAGMGGGLDRHGLTGWPADLPGDEVPMLVETPGPAGATVRGYPAIVEEHGDAGTTRVGLRVLADPASQVGEHRRGLRRLLLLDVGLPTGRVTSRWTGSQALALASSPYPSTDALVADIQLVAIDVLLGEHLAGRPATEIRTGNTYTTLRAQVRDRLEDTVYRVVADVVATLDAARELDADVRAASSLALLATLQDVREHAASLVHDGFVPDAGAEHLRQLPRYLRADRQRLAKAAQHPARDAQLAWQVHELLDALDDARDSADARGAPPAQRRAVEQVRWMIEELRVSLFAQQLGTTQPVSDKRVRRAIAALG